MNRSEIREVVLKFLYSLELQKVDKDEYEEQIQLFLEADEIEDKKVEKYIKDAVYGIEKNREEIINQIKDELSEKWEIRRLSKMSLAILKLAVYEMIYAKVPYKVVINEAVELAKKYGDDSTPAFVNGILGSVVKKNNIEEQ